MAKSNTNNNDDTKIAIEDIAKKLLHVYPKLAVNEDSPVGNPDYCYFNPNTKLWQMIGGVKLGQEIANIRIREFKDIARPYYNRSIIQQAVSKESGGGDAFSFLKELDNFNTRGNKKDYSGYYYLPLENGLAYHIESGKVDKYNTDSYKYTWCLPTTADQLKDALKQDFYKTKTAKQLKEVNFRGYAEDLKCWIDYQACGLLGNPLKMVMVLYSQSDGGTSVLGNLMQLILGDRGQTLDTDLIMDNKNKAEYGLARLRTQTHIDVRQADKGKLNVSLLSKLSGNDSLDTRDIYGKIFKIRGRHNITLICNRPPSIELKAGDNSMITRLIGYRFNEIPVDKQLDYERQLLPIFTKDLPVLIAEICKQATNISKALEGGKNPKNIIKWTDRYKEDTALVFGEATGLATRLEYWKQWRIKRGEDFNKVHSVDLCNDFTEIFSTHNKKHRITARDLKQQMQGLGIECKQTKINDKGSSGYDLTEYWQSKDQEQLDLDNTQSDA
ncbi:MAG: hypothetical protein OXF30_00500 [Candidatus Saccharibacteria bacterium]|nr:hypothetical protein [Candidatus Saccharibacteria bacterium]